MLDPEQAGELLDSTRTLTRQLGIRTVLAVPLQRGDEAIGAIQLYWLRVRPVSDSQRLADELSLLSS